MRRKPGGYTDGFVRGKSSYFPFRPGGLGEVFDDDGGDEERAVDGMEKALEKACEYSRPESSFIG